MPTLEPRDPSGRAGTPERVCARQTRRQACTQTSTQTSRRAEQASMSSAPHLLREACERGDAEGARRALARGGAHLLDDPLGRSGLGPLHVAADRGRLELLRFLIGRGADIHLRTRGGSTPLALASRGGHTSCVKALLMAGADPSEVSGRNGWCVIALPVLRPHAHPCICGFCAIPASLIGSDLAVGAAARRCTAPSAAGRRRRCGRS